MSESWTDRVTRVAKDIGWPHADLRGMVGIPGTALLHLYVASHATIDEAKVARLRDAALRVYLIAELEKTKRKLIKFVEGIGPK